MQDEIVVQARHAAAIAEGLCAPTGCAWYHGIWPTLRALDLVASPHRNGDFFARALRDAPGARVLVTGSADAGMAEVVLAARPDAFVTVLDRCPTPVAVSLDAGVAAGTRIEGWVADVLDTGSRAGSFDILVTHGLFGIVPVDRRLALAAAWSALLAPGGRLITTTSISAPRAPDPVTFSAEAVDGFAARASSAAVGRAGELCRSPEAIGEAARAWASRAVVHPVRSVENVAALLTASGLVVDISLREVAGTLPAVASGPWSARSARYAEIVAVKP